MPDAAIDLWEVRDVVSHLAYVAEIYTERIHESLQVDPSASEGQPAAGPVSATSLAEGNAEQAISRRESLGGQVFSDFIKTSDQLNRLMATLGPEDWDKPHYYSSLGTETMRSRPDLWIAELAMHGWDIRSRLETEAHMSDESLPASMDVVTVVLPIYVFSPCFRLPEPIRYRLELTGVGARNSDIVVEGDKISMERAGTGKADVTFRSDIETFVFIASGRLTIDAATATDRLTIEGDNRLAYDFQRWFPGT